MINTSNLQEDITILNMCVPNYTMLSYAGRKLIELQRGIDEESTVKVGNFNTSQSEMARSSMQKISKNIAELNNTVSSS